jgi:hypothetical protein
LASYKGDYSGQSQSNPTVFNRVLRGLSNVFGGLDYNDMKIKNAYALGVHEETSDVAFHPQSTNMYDLFTKKTIARFLDKKSIAYLDRSYLDKRKILRQYSIKDEIKDFIIQICDECIIYDENNKFCYVKDLPETFDHTIRQKYQETFSRIMNEFNFIDGVVAWNYLRTLLIDGYIAFEIIYDDRQKNIIDLAPLDPLTLVVATDPMSNTMVWIQFPDNPQLRRVLLDSQIIYISYSNNNEYGDTSYIESLIRPYNQLKMLEQAKLLYNINQASLYKKFIIPVDGLSRQQAEQQIYELMSDYHEDVQWDEHLGLVQMNGSTNIPHSKDFWFPSSGGMAPQFDIVRPEQNNLAEDTTLQWFYKNFKRASKIPFQRHEEETGGGTLYDSTTQITRDEIKFKNYITRIRTIFKEILTKPLRIQMILDFPELKKDVVFANSMRLLFNSDVLFEEWKYLANLDKRAQIAAGLSSNLVDMEGKPFLSVEFLARRIMKFTDADIEENEKYKMIERKKALQNAGLQTPEGGGPPGGPPGGGGSPMGGGGPQPGPGPEMGGAQGVPPEGGGPQGGPQGGGPQGGGPQGGGPQGGAPPQGGGGQTPTI